MYRERKIHSNDKKTIYERMIQSNRGRNRDREKERDRETETDRQHIFSQSSTNTIGNIVLNCGYIINNNSIKITNL